MSKIDRVIIAAESDEHGGSNFGLLSPDTILLDNQKKEYIPTLNETQQLMWEIREWGRQEISHLAGKSPIVLFKVGDVNQGMKYDVDNALASQVKIAMANDEPWLGMKNLIAVRIDTGTESHSMGFGDSEELLVYNIKQRRKDLDVKLIIHGLSEVSGFWVDSAHHGPNPGFREWTKGNIPYLYLKDQMMKDVLRGRVPPNLYLRGHFHEGIEVYNRVRGPNNQIYKSWLWVLPSVCGMNGYALQKLKSEFEITNGLVAFEIVNGKLVDSYEFSKTTDLRERERII